MDEQHFRFRSRIKSIYRMFLPDKEAEKVKGKHYHIHPSRGPSFVHFFSKSIEELGHSPVKCYEFIIRKKDLVAVKISHIKHDHGSKKCTVL